MKDRRYIFKWLMYKIDSTFLKSVSVVSHPMPIFLDFTVPCAWYLIFHLCMYRVQRCCFHIIIYLMSESDTLVDGTTNFAHGYPSFAVSIGVLFRGKPATAAVVVKAWFKLFMTCFCMCDSLLGYQLQSTWSSTSVC